MAGEGAIPEAVVDGPIALDSASRRKPARRKASGSPSRPLRTYSMSRPRERGHADQGAVYLAKARVAGLLWGARRPIVHTSRADSEESKYVSLCLCKLAMEEE